MAVRKLSIAMEEDVARAVADEAASAGLTVSAFLTDAARERLAIIDGLRAVEEVEEELGIGPPSPDEEAWAAAVARGEDVGRLADYLVRAQAQRTPSGA